MRRGIFPTLTTRTTLTNGAQELQTFLVEIIDITIRISLRITATNTENKLQTQTLLNSKSPLTKEG